MTGPDFDLQRDIAQAAEMSAATAWGEGWNASADYMSDSYDGPDDGPNPYRAEVTP